MLHPAEVQVSDKLYNIFKVSPSDSRMRFAVPLCLFTQELITVPSDYIFFQIHDIVLKVFTSPIN